MKKLVATTLLVGILGVNFAPVTTYALQDNTNNTVKEKKLTRKEKKLLAEEQKKQDKLNYINIDWWESYNDEYLTGYIFKAIANNKDVELANLKVEEARQMVKLQFANELPQLTTGAAPLLMKAQNETRTTGTFAIPVLVSYEADIFLKNHDKTKSAKKLYEASEFQEKATYLTIASQVGATYYNIVKLDKLIGIQNDIIKARKEIFELKKLSNEEGIVSTADLVRAEKAYVVATSDLIELEKAREIMLTSLCVLIGESPANAKDIKRISYDKVQSLKPVPKELSQDVILERPDYLVAQKMIEKAGIDVKVAKKEFLPSINLLGILGITGSSVSQAMNWESSLAALGIGALWPVFTGGSRIANLKINKNKYEQSILNYQKTNLTAIKEVNDALSTLQLDNQKYLKNVKSLNMQSKDYGFTKDKYNEGIISKLDLLEEHEKLLVMNKMVISSKSECLVNQISLYKAVAGKI
ncbi:MAG: TolC family protein [Candidatus Gastranaerophilales bacterium]|nr:TolC family protein [Candidatus Gastranaerophilales bacterium]